jgi:GNAT superfamily N-acetyltransferase
MNLCLATAKDCSSIAKLVNSAYRGDTSKLGWTTEADLLGGQRTDEADLMNWIQSQNQVLLFLPHAEGPKGCVKLNRDPDNLNKAHLGMLTIQPSTQNKGLGRQTLQEAEVWAQENWNINSIEITVIQLREELIAWYERRGFRLTGAIRPFPYGQPAFGLPKREDLHFVVMEKLLA